MLGRSGEVVAKLTPEGKVKKAVVDILKAKGAYYFFPVTGGYGRSGIPDIIVCWKGKFIAIECKANGRAVTALQDKELKKIQDAEGMTITVDEFSVDVVRIFLQ